MTEEPVLIVPYRDGPYLIRGPVSLRDQTGMEIEAGRRVIALCRCGKSRLRPFCDGSHHLIHFRAPSEREDRTASASAARETVAPEADLSTLDGEILRLRNRLVAVAKLASGPDDDSRVADAARLLAAASTALHGGAVKDGGS